MQPQRALEKEENKSELDPNSFCWREELTFRYESLWSLTHKFALLNAVSSPVIREVFGQRNPGNKGDDNWKWSKRDDLRIIYGFYPSNLALLFHFDEQRVMESTVDRLVKQNEIDTLTCKTLRYCNSCVKKGFHSPLYQLLFLSKCPHHDEDLITYCLNCDHEIPYRLNSIAFSYPYACPRCKTSLCKELQKIGGYVRGDEKREAILKQIQDWLYYRLESGALEKTIGLRDDYERGLHRIKQEIHNLTSFWLETFAFSGQQKELLSKQTGTSQDTEHHSVYVRAFKKDEKISDLFGREWDTDLYKIYKSIARYFRGTILKDHISCIRDCGENLWWDKDTLDCKGRICNFANSYLLWRMYYEGLDHHINLFKKFKRVGFGRPHTYWDPPTYRFSESILKRIFALECYWMFFECLDLAREFNKEGKYSLNTIYVSRTLMPHWIVLKGKGLGQLENYGFHYWVTPEMVTLASNITS